MTRASPLRGAIVLLLVAAAVAAPAAHADGDPASDYLIVTDVFAPTDLQLPKQQTEVLTGLVRDARAKGYRVKVALIGSRYDLGSVVSLWRQPQRYASFLGQELFYSYKGVLLVAMPNGYGVFHHGASVKREQAALASLPTPTPAAAGEDLATAATRAVRKLAATGGVALAIPGPAAPRSENGDRLKIIVGAAAILLVVAAASLYRRSRRGGGLGWLRR